MQLDLRSKARRRTISLTPLIDVVFILLLFFMLTSTFIRWQQMELAVAASSTQSESPPHPPLVAQLYPDGDLRVDGQRFSSADDAALAALLSGTAHSLVIVQADESSRIQQIVSAIDRLERLGALSVTLNTDP